MRVLAFAMLLFAMVASYTASALGAAERIVCEITVKMNIEEGSTPRQYQSYLGLWTGGWSNGRICSGLIIKKIDGNGDAYIDYIYRLAGKNANTQSVIGHIENGQTLTFTDKDGSRYTFILKLGNELAATFQNAGGARLATTFQRGESGRDPNSERAGVVAASPPELKSPMPAQAKQAQTEQDPKSYDRHLAQLHDRLKVEQPQTRIEGTVQPRPSGRLIGAADQPCPIAEAAIDDLRQSLAVALPDGMTTRAENLLKVTWTTKEVKTRGPAYLILAVDAPARFQGQDLYIVTPDAAAPFRISQLATQTRVIVPLHLRSSSQTGEILVRPLVTGRLRISVALAGVTQCGEYSDPKPRTFDLVVEPGPPEIVIAEEFNLSTPDKIILSPDGTRRLEIHGPRFYLIDNTTGARLTDQVGQHPRFSPTGRFITDLAANLYNIIDAIDGHVITPGVGMSVDSENDDVIWDNHDSFLIGAGRSVSIENAGGIFAVQNPLNEGSAIYSLVQILCPKRFGIVHDVSFKLDLENNIAITACASKVGPADAASLTKPEERANLEHLSLIIRTAAPTNWEMIDGLKVVHISKTYLGTALEASVSRFLQPVLEPVSSASKISATAYDPLHDVRRRDDPLDTSKDLRIMHRLREFGLEVNLGQPITAMNGTGLLRQLASNSFVFDRDLNIQINTSPRDYFEAPQCGEIKSSRSGSMLIAPGDNDLSISQVGGEKFKITIIAGTCRLKIGNVTFSHAALYDSRYPGQLFNLKKQDSPIFSIGTYCQFNMFACGFQGGLFFDRYLVIWSQKSADIVIYDLELHKTSHILIRLPSPDEMIRVSLSKDLKSLLKIDKDGSFQLIELPPDVVFLNVQSELNEDPQINKPPILLSGRVVDDEVAIWTRSGLFDTTNEGAAQIAIRFPGLPGEYTLEQFRRFLHVDDLLTRVLAGEVLSANPVKEVPPTINVDPRFSSDGVTAHITSQGNEAVSDVRIYQDGVLTDTVPMPRESKSLEVKVRRLPGSHWITFLAKGTSGLYSKPASFDGGQPKLARHHLYSLSIGIDHYDDERIQALRYAANDAARFSVALRVNVASNYEIVSQTLLTDSEASPDAVIARLSDAIGKAGPSDTVALFIAGHGIQTPDLNYFLATSTTRIDDMTNTALSWRDISAVLSKARSRVLIFLDTCQSGNAGTSFFTTNDSATNVLLDRAPSGVLIFSASKGRELSEEAADYKGGIFTSALIQALSDKQTDVNRNGAIEASELYAAVKRSVVNATEGRQTPWFGRNNMLGDFVPF